MSIARAYHVEFTDRQQAGQRLAQELSGYSQKNVLVLGLARGGVVVASQIADILHLPLDVLVVKKIPSMSNSELAIGALAPDGVSFMEWRIAHKTGADEDYVREKIQQLNQIIDQKTRIYRKGRKPLAVTDKHVIVVDDGAATGATMEAAIRWLRKKRAKKIIVALPVASLLTTHSIRAEADEVVVLFTPRDFDAVGQFYGSFPQVEDAEVIAQLNKG